MVESSENSISYQSEKSNKLERYIKNLLNIKGVKFFALTDKNYKIIEKKYKDAIDERIIGALISKVSNICNWVVSKLENTNFEEIEIKFKTGAIILKQSVNGYFILLLIERFADKSKISSQLNALTIQIDHIFDSNYTPTEFSELDKNFKELEEIVNGISIPKFSEIKKLLKYITN